MQTNSISNFNYSNQHKKKLLKTQKKTSVLSLSYHKNLGNITTHKFASHILHKTKLYILPNNNENHNRNHILTKMVCSFFDLTPTSSIPLWIMFTAFYFYAPNFVIQLNCHTSILSITRQGINAPCITQLALIISQACQRIHTPFWVQKIC